MKNLDLNKETLRGYALLNRIESMAKIARIATTDINNNALEVEDFKEIFKSIEELASEATVVISNLETAID
jgi:hypothetical protein